MQLNEKTAAVEAILFASGEPIDEEKIAESAGIEINDVTVIIKSLNQRYNDMTSALNIVHLGSKYQMCTRKEYSEYIKAAMESTNAYCNNAQIVVTK